MPGKIERFGIRTHGLVKCPITVMPDGSEVCYLRDYTITTRGGKTLPMPYTGDKLGQYVRTKICPRPFLYMHPLASMETEDADGLDWSGYVVFYDSSQWRDYMDMWGYMGMFACAYTPSDNSQAVLFFNQLEYAPPLNISEGIGRRIKISSPDLEYSHLMHVSKDGRFRVAGKPARYFELEPGSGISDPPPISAYIVSDDHEQALSLSKASVPTPDFEYTEWKNRPVARQTTAGTVSFGFSGNIYEGTGRQWTINWRPVTTYDVFFHGHVKAYIDMWSDGGDVKYLYLSTTADSSYIENYNSPSGTGGGYILTPVEPYWNIDTGEWVDHEWVQEGYTVEYRNESQANSYSKEVVLSGFGGSSALVFDSSASAKWRSTRTHVPGGIGYAPITTDKHNHTREGSTTVSLDGVVLYSKKDSDASRELLLLGERLHGGAYLGLPEPRIIEGIPADELWSYEIGKNGTGADIVTVIRHGVITLAEGIQAIFAFVTTAEATGITSFNQYVLIESSIKRTLRIGRVFGFGISRAGFEVPKNMWDKKLYAAYDPVSKKISDVYNHPVFYQ